VGLVAKKKRRRTVRIAFRGKPRTLWQRATKLIAVLPLVGGLFVAITPPAVASASANTQCGYGSSAGNTRTCLTIGSRTASTSATVVYSGRVLRSCLRLNGARLACSAYTYVTPGAGIGNTWIAGGAVPDGTYCAVTWKLAPDGVQSRIGTICVGIGTTIIG
jgi:hypothetical protein